MATGKTRVQVAALALFWGACCSAAWGVTNLGFESAPQGDGSPPGWTLTTSDQAVLSTGDDGLDYEVYGEFGITVEPLRGARSLLLNTPKRVNESQNRGATVALSDPFVPVSSTLTTSLRLFSLEHRGDDQLSIEVLDADPADGPLPAIALEFIPGQPAGTGLLESATTKSCTPAGCSFTIDIGKRNKRPYDSGKYLVNISNLPTDSAVQLRYTVLAGNNEAHASWAYFDDANQPPVSDFVFSPGGEGGTVLEGDLITLLSKAVDPNDDPMTLTWLVDGVQQAEGAVGLVSFPQDGSYAVTLIADDGETQTSSTRTIQVSNAAPLVQPLTLEVTENQPATAVCNWLDAGIEDPTFVTISVPGNEVTFDAAVTGNLETVPALASGQETLTFATSGLTGTAQGSCTVADDDTATSVNFDIVVLTDTQIDEREMQDDDSTLSDLATGDGPPMAMANTSLVGRLQSPTDIDVYRVCAPAPGYVPGDNPLLPSVMDCDLPIEGAFFQQLPTKSKVFLSLDSPGVDYDLLAFVNAEEESPFLNAPFVGAPFVGVPFVGVDFENAPFVGAVFGGLPFVGAPFVGAPFVGVPFVGVPFVGVEFDSSPFVGVGSVPSDASTYVVQYRNIQRTELFGAPDGSTISGVDTNWTETGSDSLKAIPTQNVQFVGLSANVAGKEQLVVEIAPGKSLYIVVAATNGSFSSAPYRLSSQVSLPVDQELVFGDLCRAELNDPYIVEGATTTPVTVYPQGTDDSAAGYSTYMLTQRERFQKAYGLSDSQWDTFIADLTPYLEATNTKLVSVPSAWFDAADKDICDVQLQNALSVQIRDYLQSRLNAPGAAVDYVQILGSYIVIPPRYEPDETTILNESLYGPDLLTTPSPLGFAFGQGHNAIDSFYTTFEPIPYRGRFLYVEDLSISRLLETPAEILATALGQLDPASLSGGSPVLAEFPAATGSDKDLVGLGYDFFVDGTDDALATLAGIPGTSAPISLNPGSLLSPGELWGADDFRCYLLGDDSVTGCARSSSPALSVANFHASHNACLPARDFAEGADANDFSGADVVRSTEAGGSLIGRLFTTIGCHSLLSVADPWVPAAIAALDLPVPLAADWAQQGGTKVGPIGFGSGHDSQLRGSEFLAALHAQEMAKGWSVGVALVNAKKRYVASLVEVSPNDEDAIVNHSVSGVAQAKITGTPANPQGAEGGATAALAAQFSPSTGVSFAGGFLNLTIFEDGVSQPFSYAPALAARADHPESWGSWFTLDNRADAITNRTLLPRYTPPDFDFRALSKNPDENWIHGFVLREQGGLEAARYVDLVLEDAGGDPAAGNPVFPVEKHDWIKKVLEPQPCVETLAPTQLASAGVLRSRNEARQTLAVVGAQFRCRPEFAVPVEKEINGKLKTVLETRGDFRVFTGLTMTALHPLDPSLAGDFLPPEVLSQQFVASLDSDTVEARVSARDDNGIRGIVVLVYRPVDCTDPVASADFTAECAEGRAGFIDSEEVFFGPDYPTTVTDVTFTLENAKNNLFAVQYIDVGGNVVSKSLKGTLQRAIEVDVLNTNISLFDTELRVFVEDLATLTNVLVTTRVCQGECDSAGEPVETLYELDDPALAGVIEIDEVSNVITFLDFDVGQLAEEFLTIEVLVKAQGVFGRDLVMIGPCLDAADDVLEPELQDANFVGCGFRAEGTRVFIDMVVNGEISDDYQYRAQLEGYGGQVKLNDGFKISGPGGSHPAFSKDGNRLTLSFDAAVVGWDGVTPVTVITETQAGVKGKKETGFIDEMIFPGEP